jgi:protein phosphatase
MVIGVPVMKILAYSNKGTVRDHNEDCFFIQDQTYVDTEVVLDKAIIIAAVLDGVGGSECGEVASKTAADYFHQHYMDSNESSIIELLRKCNDQVLLEADQTGCEGMATTIAGIALDIEKSIVTIFNIGDSRVYRVRKGLLKQLSYDHSMFNMLKEMNKVATEDYSKYQDNHTITDYLGNKNFTDQSVYYNSIDFGVREKDIFFICSDGVSDQVNDEQLLNILNQNLDREQLKIVINENILMDGAPDNFTYIYIEI